MSAPAGRWPLPAGAPAASRIGRSRRAAAIAVLSAIAGLGLAGCSAGGSGAGGGDAEAEPSPTAEALTCENIIPESLVASLDEIGWEAIEEPFMAGSTELEDGIQCKWGDPDGTGGGNVQIYGLAAVDADQAADIAGALEDDGWKREEDGDVVYITEDPEFAFAVDEDGYGYTYAFGDGWAAVSDTKAGIAVIG